MSRRPPPPDSPPPLAPAALDLPPAAAPRLGPMRGTGIRFGPSLSLPRRGFACSSSVFCCCFSALGRSEGSAARRRPPLAGGARGRLCGQTSDAGAWSSYLPEPYLPVILQEGETYLVPICEGALCVCVLYSHVWLSGETRGGLRTESLAFSCCHFSVSPFAFCPFSQGLGTGLSVSLCPAFLMLASSELTPLGSGRVSPPQGVLGLGAGPQPWLSAGSGPYARHTPPGLGPCPAAAAHTSGPARAHLPSPGCLSLLLLLSVTLGWK